jgi:threonine/homoserine/homoserine lactone efflux protein
MPHIVGIALGFPVMIVAVGLGFGGLFAAYPTLHQVLKYVAFAYLLWLAWRIARSGRPDTSVRRQRPFTVMEAALFQWVNPKAWAIVFATMALFTTVQGNKLVEIAVVAALFGIVCLPNGVVWGLFGQGIAGFLSDDRRRNLFNLAMAALLVVSGAPGLF